jgi:DNA-binding GntR family transcriptional regulator
MGAAARDRAATARVADATRGRPGRPARPGLKLAAIDPHVLGHQVAAQLRGAILSGDIAPGTHLREQQVAASTGVSRVPVREALRQLENEGLIEVFPYRGAIVVGVSSDELDAIYELRAVIEGAAMRRLAPSASPEVLARLADQVREMKRAVARGNGVDKLAELDIRFHRTILEASGFQVLRRIRDGLDEILRVRSFYQGIQRGGPTGQYFRRTLATSHDRLLTALRSGQANRAADAAREHVMEVVDRLGTKAGDPGERR